jgi:hypothetical protein
MWETVSIVIRGGNSSQRGGKKIIAKSLEYFMEEKVSKSCGNSVISQAIVIRQSARGELPAPNLHFVFHNS